MKLPDFLEESNQGAEKTFGENTKSMIDSLLYAKLFPKLKRSVNMARLENGTYEEIDAHLERELELNALEESDDFCQWPLWPQRPPTTAIYCPLVLTPTRTPNARIAKLRATTTKAAPNSKRKRNWRIKTAKSTNVQLTRNAQPAGKRTTPLNGAGKEQGHIYVPKGRTRMIRPMTHLERKRHPRSQIPRKQTL